MLFFVTIYPPWLLSIHHVSRTTSEPYGWYFIWDPPDTPDKRIEATGSLVDAVWGQEDKAPHWPKSWLYSVQIDFKILLLEWIALIVLAAVISVFLKLATENEIKKRWP